MGQGTQGLRQLARLRIVASPVGAQFPPMKLLPVLLLCVLASPCDAGSAKQRWSLRLEGDTHAIDADQAGNVGFFGFGRVGSRYRFLVGKFASDDGRRLWRREHGGMPGYPSHEAAAVEPGGDVIVSTSYEVYNPSFSYTTVTARYAGADGAVRWKREELNVPAPARIVFDGRGGFIALAHDPISGQAVLANYSLEDGSRRWTTPTQGIISESFPRFEQLHPVTGERGGAVAIHSAPGKILNVVRVDGEGRLLWQKRFPLTRNDLRNDFFRDSAVSRTGDVALVFVVSSTPATSEAFSHQIITKLSGGEGRTLWRRVYKAPVRGSYTNAISVVINSRGDVITGSEDGDGGLPGYVLYRPHFSVVATFAARNGALRSINSEHSTFHFADMAMDGDDSLVVNTVRTFHGGGPRFVTTKRDREGNVLWTMKRPWLVGAVVDNIFLGAGFQVLDNEPAGGARGLLIKYVDGATPETKSVFEIGSTSAGVRGVVNANGFEAAWSFEFGRKPDLADRSATVASPIPRGAVARTVEGTLSNLQPDTKYYYRTVATANENTTRGEIRSFRTLPWE
jgi:hypothetical protein